MENNIEKFEKSRYRYSLLITVLFPLWYLPTVVAPPFEGGPVAVGLAILLIVGIVVTIRLIVKLQKVKSAIRSDAVLNEALNGELYKEYENKSSIWALWSVFAVLATLSIVLRYVEVEAYRVCMALMLIVVMAKYISWLIYNRE